MLKTQLLIGALTMLTVAGCATGGSERNEQVSNVLDQFDTDTEYASTERCLSSFDYDRVEILDEQHLLFRDNDDYWLNELRARCPGLHRNDTLLFERTSSRLCNLDTAQAVDHFLFWRRTGPVCTLGDFHELSENQAELLRNALES